MEAIESWFDKSPLKPAGGLTCVCFTRLDDGVQAEIGSAGGSRGMVLVSFVCNV